MQPTPDFKRASQLAAVRILLLEDDEAFAGLVRANLERAHWADLSIEHAATLRDALARLEGGGFDLVITDLNLPDSKGLETLESLVRATDRLILVLSGERNEGLREAAIDLGAYDLMSKDLLDRAELERLVRLAAMQANTFRSLRDSEERFRGLTELSADWYWEQDAELRFVATGGATDARGGITPEAHVGKCRWELPHTEILGQTWEEHKLVLQSRQSFHDLVLRRAGANNETRYVSVSGRPFFGEQGLFSGYRGVAKDVTRRVQVDLRLAIEHSVTRLLGESNSVAEAVPQIIRAVCETLGLACGARMEHDERNQLMVCTETWGVASAGIEAFLHVGRQRPAPLAQPGGLIRRAWAEGKPTWIRDVTQDPTFRRAADAAKAGLHSAFAFPIKLGAQSIGVMEFFSTEIRQPDADLLDCMTYIGSQLGQFMQRKRAEEEQRRFRAAIDASADVVLLIDPASMLYVDANETACRTLGYSREELLAMGPHELFSASREDLSKLYARLIAGDQSAMTAEGWYRHKGGHRIFIESFRRVVPSAKGHVIVVVARDVGERKRAEQLLKLEHTVTRSLADADSASEGLVAAIRSVCESEGWECGRYLYEDEKAGLMRLGAAWGTPNPDIEHFLAGSREVSYAPGVGLVGKVWQSGQPLWIADVEKDGRTVQKGIVRDIGLHGAIFFPVLSDGKTIGVLAFNSREIREPDERLLQAVRVIGSQLGQFVQRKQAEAIMRESEERFRSLTQLSSDMYWEQDEQFRFTSQSGTGSERVGVRSFPLLGKKRWEQNYINMTADDWARHRALLDAHKPFRDLELCRPDEAGQEVWINISGEPVFDETGAFKGYRGIGKDITGRRRAEQLLKLEHTVTRSLAEADSAPAGLETAIRSVCQTEGWECGRYFRPDDKAGVLRLGTAWGVPIPEIERYIAGSRDIAYSPGVGLVGRVWQTGQPIWVSDLYEDARVSQPTLARDSGVHGAFVFPVMSEGKTIGVLAFNSREVRQPEERLLQAIHVIGSQIGQFVQRKQAEEVRRESEERFRSLTGLSSDWYWEQDESLRFTLISSTTKDTTGRGPLANIGKTRWDMPALNMTGADWAAHRALLEARKPFYDLLLHRRTPDGRSKYTSISGEPMFDAAGAFKGYRGVGKDITERKREELLLDLEHTVTRSLSEADSVSGALKSTIRAVCESQGWECGRYFYADEKAGVLRFGEAWGIADPAIERYIDGSRQRTYPLDSEKSKARAWRNREPLWTSETTRRGGLGQSTLGSVRDTFAFAVVAEGKAPGVLTFTSREVRAPDARLLQTARVIGSQIGQFVQRKLAEEVMRESEARFRSLTTLSSDFFWETDAEHRMVQTDYAGQHQPVIPRGQRFGKTRWEVPSTYPGAAGWAAHRATLEAHLPFRDFELARIDDRGAERYLSISGEAIFDAGGRFKGYRGVGKDISARKQAEERQATHTRYQEKIARFGASALGKREASDLIEDALQNVVEALPATVVVYVEPGGGERELVMRSCAGLAAAEPASVACYGDGDAVARALEHGQLAVVDRPASGARLLPFGWAAAFHCAAMIPVHGDNRVQGALCVLSEVRGAFGAEESKFLVTAASVLSAGLRRIDSEGRLAFLAQFDALTGLPNRALLSDRFSQLIVQARRHATQLGVLFIDLDDFKLVNDSLGHAGGDELLKEAARRLQSTVRAGDTVARISGDEFAVILTDLARPDDAALVAQKIIERLAAPVQVRGHEVFVTASIGISAFPADGGDAESLIGAADAAMYRAKQSGRNGYQFFTTEINQRTRARAQLGSELRRALEREEFALVYQPKYDLQSGQPCAAEALLRWNHPERGVVSPGEFIPVLEETGLIVAVGEWVLQRACKDIRAWQAAGAVVVPVAVNLSARQFRQQDLDVRLIGLVKAAGVEPKLIELEITESQLMQDPDHAIRVMRSLSEAGIRIAIDDFGTGYSSLSYLTRFPVAALKIDRSFVADVLSDPADAAIVRTIIDMAHTLGSIVVAEGVETEAQAALLRGLGCEQAQGYFFARPMPEADLRTLLASHEKRPPRKVRAASRAK